jgi:hypothetical protein
VVRTHPVTGRKALYVNPNFTTRIVGLKRHESDALLEMLYRHCETPEFQCRFAWRPNSIAFWDNRSAQHHAMWDYFPHKRLGYRVTVKGDKPFFRLISPLRRWERRERVAHIALALSYFPLAGEEYEQGLHMALITYLTRIQFDFRCAEAARGRAATARHAPAADRHRQGRDRRRPVGQGEGHLPATCRSRSTTARRRTRPKRRCAMRSKVYKAEGCDGIIAIGGGSPMDLAKAVGLMATHPGDRCSPIPSSRAAPARSPRRWRRSSPSRRPRAPAAR